METNAQPIVTDEPFEKELIVLRRRMKESTSQMS
jgi:hypothetical protein